MNHLCIWFQPLAKNDFFRESMSFHLNNYPNNVQPDIKNICLIIINNTLVMARKKKIVDDSVQPVPRNEEDILDQHTLQMEKIFCQQELSDNCYDNIALIYEDTIGKYINGRDVVYNPYIMCNLDVNTFYQWIMHHNPHMRNN